MKMKQENIKLKLEDKKLGQKSSIQRKDRVKALDRLYAQFQMFFVKNYKKIIKNAFSAKKVEGSSKLIREGNPAVNFLTSNNHLNIVDITNIFAEAP